MSAPSPTQPPTLAALQALYDAIPAHAAQPMRLSQSAGTLALAGALDGRSGRGPGLDQAHGGVLAALLDTAAALVLIAGDGRSWSTVDLRVDYLRPVPLGPVRVEATVLHAGRRIGRSRAELCDAHGRPRAVAVATLVP